MITVKVTYTVKPEYVTKNQENIALFMKDFKELKTNDFQYAVYLSSDGKTFVHQSAYKNEKVQQQVLNMESFKEFQKQRDESGLEAEPQIDVMTLVDSTKEILVSEEQTILF